MSQLDAAIVNSRADDLRGQWFASASPPAGTAHSPTLYLLTHGPSASSLRLALRRRLPGRAHQRWRLSFRQCIGPCASADPSRLPTPDQERAVTAALATAG